MQHQPTATYAELKAQADAIMAQAEQARIQERAGAIQQINEIMSMHGLTIADFGGVPSKATQRKVSKSASKAPAKYRGPNGELWAGGLGRKPEWVRRLVAEGKSLEEFLI